MKFKRNWAYIQSFYFVWSIFAVILIPVNVYFHFRKEIIIISLLIVFILLTDRINIARSHPSLATDEIYIDEMTVAFVQNGKIRREILWRDTEKIIITKHLMLKAIVIIDAVNRNEYIWFYCNSRILKEIKKFAPSCISKIVYDNKFMILQNW